MVIGVPRETFPGERRVALVPAVIPSLTKAGFQVSIEAGAGSAAGYLDSDYTAKGAQPRRTDAEPRCHGRRGAARYTRLENRSRQRPGLVMFLPALQQRIGRALRPDSGNPQVRQV